MSKKINTVEQLESAMQQDIAWRKKEMVSLKILVEKDNVNEELLLRASIALLCAHFEGFIKFASNAYIKFVSAQEIENRELTDNFPTFMLKGKFKECSDTEKVSIRSKLISAYSTIANKPFKVKNDVISTHSNPSTPELEEIMKSIGVETDIFRTKARYIDTDLLSNRHKVVHGERSMIDKTDFETTFSMIMKLLDQFAKVIISAADEKKYLKEESI